MISALSSKYPSNHTLLKTPVVVSLATLLMLVVFSVPLILFLNQYHADVVTEDFIKQESRVLNEQIKQKMDIGDTIALSFARNSRIRDALLLEERLPIIQEVSGVNRLFAENTRFQNVQLHVMTADGRSLVKTFNLDSYSQNLTMHDLVKKAVMTGKAASGINIGGAASHFRVINIQPIYALDDPDEVIGFIGVSQGLRSIIESFATHKVNYALFSPLLNSSETSDLGSRTFTIGKAPYFANNSLSSIQFQEADVLDEGLHLIDGKLIYTQPIKDQENHLLAFHAVSIPLGTFDEKVWERNVEALYILLAILLSTLTVSGLLLLVIKRSVIKPLSVFEATIRQIISSKQYKTPVEIHTEDEIGRLSHQFNLLLQQIAELIHSLKYQQEAIDSSLIVSKTDLDGTITYVNQQFEKISGYTAKELIGQPHSIVRHPDMPKEVFADLWRTIKSNRVWKGQIKNLRKDGKPYYVTTHILPIVNQQGVVIEYMSIREDITEIVELKESLEAAKEMAEKANQAKSQFLSSMSHELRTPLNAIIGFSQLLEFSDLTDKQYSQLGNISRSGRHLLHLINDILELSKVESGSLEISLEEVYFSELVKDALNMVEALARQRGILIHCPTKEQLDCCIRVDYTRIKQVLLNFLSNAIKYNRDGGQVRVFAETYDSEECLWMRLHVKDTGFGISESDQENLFEPFNRLGHENSNIEGTGIGLSIAKDLVEKMGGHLGVESTEGEGSDFWFSFPVCKQDSGSESIPKTLEVDRSVALKETHRPQAVKRVLYIEDNPSNRGLMQDIVSTVEGVELSLAPDAEQGLEMAETLLPDVMFIDINLPGMNGDELLPILKRSVALQKKGTVFYALTANAMMLDVERGKRVGFDDYLTKPINIKEIIAILTGSR